MIKLALLITSLATVTFAENNFDFTPSLLVKVGASQILKDGAGAGSVYVDVVEAGFELVYKEKLAGTFVLEYDESAAAFAEAFLDYQFTDHFSLTGGQFVNGFGTLETEALSTPLILDIVETNVPGFQANFLGEKLYGGLAVYQGMNDNFKAIVPSFGVNINDVVDFKVASRIDATGDDVYTDISTSIGIFPTDVITVRGELYVETAAKPVEDSEEKAKGLGYYAEVDFFVGENWTLLSRFDQVILDTEADKKSGETMIHGGVGYNILEPLRVGLAVGANNAFVADEDDWTPFVAAELKLEL